MSEHSLEEQKKLYTKYWKLGEWKKLIADDLKTWSIGQKKNGDNRKQATPQIIKQVRRLNIFNQR